MQVSPINTLENSEININENIESTAFQRTRFLTATSLFDGHDASINIIRRLLQQEGAEVIHLGHNRSVSEILRTAVQEDVQGIAISSYQGGHMEYFKYLVDQLRENGMGHIKVFGGGGGVIVQEEIDELHNYGVEYIYSPSDGQKIGLPGIARDMILRCKGSDSNELIKSASKVGWIHYRPLALTMTAAEALVSTSEKSGWRSELIEKISSIYSVRKAIVVGVSGMGGAGKSSLLDEFVRLLHIHFPEMRIGILSVDPTRRKTGGALLGDRLRMNSVYDDHIFQRSVATREDNASLSASLSDLIAVMRIADFDIIFVESAGMGQADTSLADHCDFNIFVMTAEYGADTQLEKIGMLDYADMVILNKYDREKSEDAFKSIRRQYRRNHNIFGIDINDEQLPIFATTASHFNDAGVEKTFEGLLKLLSIKFSRSFSIPKDTSIHPPVYHFVSPGRRRYLSEISQRVRDYHKNTGKEAEICNQMQSLRTALQLSGYMLPVDLHEIPEKLHDDHVYKNLAKKYNELSHTLSPETLKLISEYSSIIKEYANDTVKFKVRDREITAVNFHQSISGMHIPKVAVPQLQSWGDQLSYLRAENLPGYFPFTAGVFPFKRDDEEPTRMFAGEGNPERTNRRFHMIRAGQKSARLSTAFDSITLYGDDPDERPDIYGKIGNAGVSICTLDDMKKLYSGFELCNPLTSVSMTINGPAPVILSYFFHTAIDQQIERHLLSTGQWESVENKINQYFKESGKSRPVYQGPQPEGNSGLGLGSLGVSLRDFVDEDIYQKISAQVLSTVRGTVQADILKEDQAQNTCIFSTEFALKTMGDMQQFFCDHDIANFYSVSVSGYHIAEAGANPISQTAFTLANGFTYAEAWLARGMQVDAFARNMSFFFSNGMDPEYAVIGRVARRIWAIAMKYRYKASERSQKLKYHIQTSGRSLHAMEVSFNDIRTTLQALYAIMDNCNSLHTNAYDEAITTPTPESVRRAIAIQLIINRELGLTANENPMQGSYFLSRLTEMVEEAILTEFDRISERGGVMGAMETMYQRNKIQEESMYYEGLKKTGELPIIGVNTWLSDHPETIKPELMRSTEEEKNLQINSLRQFKQIHESKHKESIADLQQTAAKGGNIFETLMKISPYCSLGEITSALYASGGRYRRNM